MKLNRLLLAGVLSAAMLAGAIQLPAPVHAQTADPVVVGAGDIVNCGVNRDEETAKLLDTISGTVITFGDSVYPDGSPQQFADCYNASWGRHKSRTMPSVGNHEYHIPGAAGYFGYFGKAASPQEDNCTSDCKGYYSYNLGAWHIVVLNSEVDMKAGSPQNQWLRADLAANRTACTLAYWHAPLYSSGTHGNASRVRPLWEALYEYGADVVLNGHDHRYERFAPQNATGQADPKGIREFVAGTGGAKLYPQSVRQPNSEAQNDTDWGVIKLTLHAASYDWEFVPIAGQTYNDKGSANCVTSGPVPPTPTAGIATPTSIPSTPNPTLPAPTPTAGDPGSDLIFADSFENGLAAWSSSTVDKGDLNVIQTGPESGKAGAMQMSVVLDDNNSIFVTDDSPNGETRYRARFTFDPNSLTMKKNNAFFLFNGFIGNNKAILRAEFGRSAAGYQIRMRVLDDMGAETNTAWVPLSDALHFIEVDWQAASDGGVTLWVDGVQAADLTGIDTDGLRIDRIRLGAIAGVDTPTRGAFFIDAFESRRRTYIGPLQ